MDLPLHQVDAFSDRVFGGNPAAVVPLDEWLEDAHLQAIAEENNLSETAFLVRRGEAYHLRWFTPVEEVPLCGHATLAAAWVAFFRLDPPGETLTFRTASGVLEATRADDGLITLSLPRLVPERCAPPPGLVEGLVLAPAEVLVTAGDLNYYAVYESEARVRDLSPRLGVLEGLHPYGVAVSAPGTRADFVSRYFAPGYGIPEDPVTGSIHCALAPYWSARLGRKRLRAMQLSRRGGVLACEVAGDRILLSGRAVPYLDGRITI
jgi:predicted PhzF superfamily epimerase YddE/YHI9